MEIIQLNFLDLEIKVTFHRNSDPPTFPNSLYEST